MVLVVVMGVSGSGKSTVGTLLADKLGWKFYEGDDYHPEENRKKMAEGIPLTDQLVRCLKLQENIEDIAMAQGMEMTYVSISKEALLENVATTKYLHLSCMQDRIPWLCHLHEILMREHASGQSVILACSALKKMYRCILENGEAGCQSLNNQQEEKESTPRKILFVHLAGPIELIASRLEKRRGHFMPPSLLQSQFDTLEPPCAPENFITVSLEKPVSETVSEIERHLT